MQSPSGSARPCAWAILSLVAWTVHLTDPRSARRLTVVSTGVCTAMALFFIHVINAIGICSYRAVLQNRRRSLAAAKKGAPEAMSEADDGAGDDEADVEGDHGLRGASTGGDDVVLGDHSAGAAGLVARGDAGRRTAAESSHGAHVESGPDAEIDADEVIWLALPINVMWVSLVLFLAAGVFFGLMFSLTRAGEEVVTHERLIQDFQYTLPVGSGIGFVVAFWTVFVHSNAKPSGDATSSSSSSPSAAGEKRVDISKLA